MRLIPLSYSKVQLSMVRVVVKNYFSDSFLHRGRRRRDFMVSGSTTTYPINGYGSCEFEPRSWRGVLNITLCDKVCQ
jgi:hypothetical protein